MPILLHGLTAMLLYVAVGLRKRRKWSKNLWKQPPRREMTDTYQNMRHLQIFRRPQNGEGFCGHHLCDNAHRCRFYRNLWSLALEHSRAFFSALT